MHLEPIVDITCGLVDKEKLPKGNTVATKPRETTLDWKGLGWLILVNVF